MKKNLYKHRFSGHYWRRKWIWQKKCTQTYKYYLMELIRTLIPHFSFLAAWLVGLLLRAPWPKYDGFIIEHANWMFFKYEKYFLQPSKLSPSLSWTLPILTYLRCFHLLQFSIISPPQISKLCLGCQPPSELETEEYNIKFWESTALQCKQLFDETIELR